MTAVMTERISSKTTRIMGPVIVRSVAQRHRTVAVLKLSDNLSRRLPSVGNNGAQGTHGTRSLPSTGRIGSWGKGLGMSWTLQRAIHLSEWWTTRHLQ